MNFYEILKTKKLGRGSPDYWTQLFAEHAGGKGEWKIAELTGMLPITFRSNGTALIDYRIFGTADGAGVQTENMMYSELEQGSLIPSTGKEAYSTARIRSDYIYIQKLDNYTIALTGAKGVIVYVYDSNKNFLFGESNVGWRAVPFTRKIEANRYVRFGFAKSSSGAVENITPSDVSNIMLVSGTTAPINYIPYGYKLPLTVTSGADSKDTDIFIGDSKLGEVEYVDYEEQKIWRKAANSYDKDATDGNNGYRSGAYLYSDGRTGTSLGFNVTEYIPTNDNKYGIISHMNTTIRSASICFYTDTTFISGIAYDGRNVVEFEIPSNATRLRASIMTTMQDEAAIYMSQYPTMITPTDPPLPFPALETFNGENTLDSTEMVGEVTIKGQIKPQS